MALTFKLVTPQLTTASIAQLFTALHVRHMVDGSFYKLTALEFDYCNRSLSQNIPENYSQKFTLRKSQMDKQREAEN